MPIHLTNDNLRALTRQAVYYYNVALKNQPDHDESIVPFLEMPPHRQAAWMAAVGQMIMQFNLGEVPKDNNG